MKNKDFDELTFLLEDINKEIEQSKIDLQKKQLIYYDNVVINNDEIIFFSD